TASISLSGQVGGIVKWQSSTDGSTWTDISSTANPLTTATLAQTTQCRAVVQSGVCPPDTSVGATVTVDPASVGGTAAATPTTICAGSTASISLSGQAGGIVKWQSSTDGSTWTDISSTANPLTTATLAQTTQFRAVVQSGVCPPDTSVGATVTVDPASVGGTAAATPTTICAGSTASISLSGQVGGIVK